MGVIIVPVSPIPNPYQSTIFVNRDNEKRTFENYIMAPNGAHLPALCFHGVGGIGKSTLREQMRSYANSQNIPYSEIDFDVRNQGNIISFDWATILYRIACDLALPCPRFFLTYSLYLLRSQDNPQLAANLLSRSVKGADFLEKLIDIAVDSPAGAPLAIATGGLSTLIGWASKGAIESIQKWEITHQKEYQNRILLSKDQLYHRLTMDLIDDLNQPKQVQENQCNSVVFFDTLEHIRPLASPAALYNTENLISFFASSTERVLVVLSGHNAVEWCLHDSKELDYWEEYHVRRFPLEGNLHSPSWPQNGDYFSQRVHLIQYRLLDLRENYAREFLEKSDIIDPDLQDVVLDSCREGHNGGYHPFSLHMCQQTLTHIYKRDGAFPDAADFKLPKGKRDSIISRYLFNLSRHEIRWLQTLAFTLRFDRDAAIAAAAFQNCPLNIDITDWDNLKCSCYVSKSTPSGWLVLHDNMRKHIIKHAPATRAEAESNTYLKSSFNAEETRKFWLDYWHNRSAAASGGTT